MATKKPFEYKVIKEIGVLKLLRVVGSEKSNCELE